MRTILILIIVFSYSVLIGQNHSNLPEKWKKYQYDHKVILTKVNFHVNDTIIPYTLVQEPYGSLSFIEGHQFTKDSITFDYSYSLWGHGSKEKEDTLIPNVVFIKNIETLELNDLSSHFSLKHDGILYTYDYDFQYQPYIHELTYSYIFYKAGLPQLSDIDTDSIIRLTNYQITPNVTNKPRVTIYELTTSSKLKLIKKLNYSIDSSHNFILTKEEYIPLKKSEIKMLHTTSQSCLKEKIKYSTKTKQHNPFLIEFKLNDHYETIERSEGMEGEDMKTYYSNFIYFVWLVNKYGNLHPSKIEKRKQKMNK